MHKLCSITPASAIRISLHPLKHWRNTLAGDLRDEGVRGRTIEFMLRFANFDTVIHDRALAEATGSPEIIRRTAFDCLSRVKLERSVRLVGVRAGNLERNRI